MNKLTKISIAAAALCSAFAVQAQEVINPSWYVQGSVQGMKPDSDLPVSKSGPGLGIRFGKPISQDWDIQIGSTYARSRDNGSRYQQNTAGIDALYMFSRKSFRPFLLAGVGAERDRLDVYGSGVEPRKTSAYLSAGAGFQADISDQWSFQADIRDVHGFIRSTEWPVSKTNNYYVTVGFNYAFSKPPVAAPAPAPVVQEAPPAPPAPMTPPPPPPPARFEKITLSSTELFAFDSAKLNAPQPKLDEIASALTAAPDVNNVVITGYADRIGSAKYNQKLSEERANSVKAYLVSHGIDSGRLSAVGKGESNPVVVCNNKKRADLIKCLEPNRRVEVEQITIERKVN